MTNNTIPNVPRDLLERVLYLMDNYIGTTHTEEDELRALLSAPSPANHVEDVRAMVAAPSPAGVDGMGNTAKLLLPALRQYMHNDGSGLLAGYDLETTQAIIDGLRGENERIRLNIAEYNEAISCYQSERNQQAQRIGELEGLLRSCLPALSDGGCAALANRIDAALAAVCAAAPNIAPTSEHSSQPERDPCPMCIKGGICNTPTCGRLLAMPKAY